MTITDNYFIKVYNEFITEGNNYHLSDRELYLYSLLYMDKRLDGSVMTTLSTIHDFMSIRFNMQKDRNIKSMKDVLNGLVKKDILFITLPDGEIKEVGQLKASDSIRVSFKEIKETGHLQVPYSIMEKCDTLSDFYIYTAVKRWENDKKNGGIFKCDYDRFARILGVARSTAQRNIDEAVEKKIIYRNIGDYKDNENGSQKIQGLNEYKVIPFEDKQKTIMTKKKENEDKYSPESVYDEYEHEDMYYSHNDLEDAYGQWGIFEDELTKEQLAPDSEAHIVALLVERNLEKRKPTKMEAKLMDKVQWRTQLMKKTPKGTEEWEKAHEEARYNLDNMLEEIGNDEKVEAVVEKQESLMNKILEAEKLEGLADAF